MGSGGEVYLDGGEPRTMADGVTLWTSGSILEGIKGSNGGDGKVGWWWREQLAPRAREGWSNQNLFLKVAPIKYI